MHIIALLVRHSCRSGSDYADCISRHENVGVGRLPASIENDIVHSMCKNQEGTFCRKHADGSTSHLSYLMAPDTTGIDSDRSAILSGFAGLMVEDFHSDDGVLLSDKSGHFRVNQHLGTMKFGIHYVGRTESERIDRTIRDSYRAYYIRIC